MSLILDHAAEGPQGFGSSRRRRPDGLTITELAASLNTTVRALRYYEELAVLQPDRTRGNARCYGPETRARAGVIVALRGLGVPLKTVQRALGDGDTPQPGKLQALCELCRVQAHERLRAVDQLEALIGAMQSLDDSGAA